MTPSAREDRPRRYDRASESIWRYRKHNALKDYGENREDLGEENRKGADGARYVIIRIDYWHRKYYFNGFGS